MVQIPNNLFSQNCLNFLMIVINNNKLETCMVCKNFE
jgi:hypothetical protein